MLPNHAEIVLGRRSSLQHYQQYQPNPLLDLKRNKSPHDVLDQYIAKHRHNILPNTSLFSQDRLMMNKITPNNPERNALENKKKHHQILEHDEDNCICQQCDCGEHKCKIKANKPVLSMSSVYKNDFAKRGNTVDSLKISPQYVRKNSTHVDIGSVYGKDFNIYKDSKPAKPIQPEGNLSFRFGQMAQNSVYKQSFPGVSYNSQLPTLADNKSHFALGLPFVSESNYRKNFNPILESKPYNSTKPDNNLKSSGPFVGQSTYNKSYIKGEDGNQLNSNIRSKSPQAIKNNYPLQLGSTYQGAYITPSRKNVCPARSLVERKESIKNNAQLRELQSIN